MSAQQDHAGIRFPPPFIYLTAILIGVALEWLWPFTISTPAPFRIVSGALFVCATAIAVSGFRELRRHETTFRPDAPSATIVSSGPYRFTRNPLYLSLATLHLAIALAIPSLWAAVMLLPAVFVIRTQVIAREEAYLERAFGESYLAYKRTVRRWL